VARGCSLGGKTADKLRDEISFEVALKSG